MLNPRVRALAALLNKLFDNKLLRSNLHRYPLMRYVKISILVYYYS